MSQQAAYAAGKIGEVCIFGPNVAEGYWRDEEATRKAFDEDGWFRSGDLGYIDDEGFLFIADRAKDIVRAVETKPLVLLIETSRGLTRLLDHGLDCPLGREHRFRHGRRRPVAPCRDQGGGGRARPLRDSRRAGRVSLRRGASLPPPLAHTYTPRD